jgi:ADP-ribose pyrophosphatase YjhB (NUDIX family)
MARIENDQGSILMVRQAVGLRLWALPGGEVRRNESLERALKREVREETGLMLGQVNIFRSKIGPGAERSQSSSESWSKGKPSACTFPSMR